MPFTRAQDFSSSQLLEAVYALGTSDKYLEADDQLHIRLDTLNLEPPSELTFGVIQPRFAASFSRLEALARKREVYGWSNCLRKYDCGLVSFALDQIKRRHGRHYTQLPVFKSAKLTNFELTEAELRQRPLRTRKRAHKDLVKETCRLLTVFGDRFTFMKPEGEAFLKALQEHMGTLSPPQQLVVFRDPDYAVPIFAGPDLRPLADRTYFILTEHQHMCLMANPVSFFTNSRLWDCCLEATPAAKAKEGHQCKSRRRWCHRCGGDGECRTSPKLVKPLTCPDCAGYFERRNCWLMHCQGRPTRCSTHATCGRCLTVQPREEIGAKELRAHDCLSYTCRHCRGTFQAVGIDRHFCVYQRPNQRKLGGWTWKETPDGPEPVKPAFFRVYFDMVPQIYSIIYKFNSDRDYSPCDKSRYLGRE